MLIKFAEAWAQGRPTSINVRFGHKPPSNVLELTDLCTRHNIIDLYLWLSNRFPGNFVERELALRQKDHAILLIQKGLKHLELSTEEIEKMGKHRPYSSSSRGTSKKKNEKDGRAAKECESEHGIQDKKGWRGQLKEGEFRLDRFFYLSRSVTFSIGPVHTSRTCQSYLWIRRH